jgi:adenine-specific DNA-methyltransferase
LIAAPLIGGRLPAHFLGLENHLNYIHRPNGTLSEEEVWGLAVLYNSAFFDAYFRALNGNTQVSATELRVMRLPPLEVIVEIGRRARACRNPWVEVENLARLAFQRSEAIARRSRSHE